VLRDQVRCCSKTCIIIRPTKRTIVMHGSATMMPIGQPVPAWPPFYSSVAKRSSFSVQDESLFLRCPSRARAWHRWMCWLRTSILTFFGVHFYKCDFFLFVLLFFWPFWSTVISKILSFLSATFSDVIIWEYWNFSLSHLPRSLRSVNES